MNPEGGMHEYDECTVKRHLDGLKERGEEGKCRVVHSGPYCMECPYRSSGTPEVENRPAELPVAHLDRFTL